MKKVSKKIIKVTKEVIPIVAPIVGPYLVPIPNAKTKKIIEKGINLLILNKKKLLI
jgi:hypothetical protein